VPPRQPVRPGARPAPGPQGLQLLGICAALFAGAMAILLLEGGSAAYHAAAGLLGMLALVTADALWQARPWAFRASAALAVAFVAVVAVGGYVVHDVGGTFALLFLSIAVIGWALVYIHRQAPLYRGPAAPAVPVPRGTP
jgi:hypothetical protein